jgi:hypothetical protein
VSANRLALYNGALALLGERSLASLTEDREPRRLLDEVWTRGNGAVRAILEQGLWNFAIRSMKLDYDTDVTPDFGFRRAHSKPTDWVRTAALCSDEYYLHGLTQRECNDERGYWFSDLDELYVRYVSDDSAYGSDLSLWPESVLLYGYAYFAREIAPRLAAAKIDDMEALAKRRLRDARSKDAMNEGAGIPVPGRWVQARRAGGWRSRDGGNRGSLIG